MRSHDGTGSAEADRKVHRRSLEPTPLVSGSSDFGSPNQVGEFHIKDQPIQPGDLIYFIVDAFADGTGTPHHGDATRFDVTLTVRDAKRSPPPWFEKDVLPVLAQICHDCHGATLQEAKLDLRTLSPLLQGGESGPAIVVGDPGGSLLVDLVAQGQMPPDGSEKLTATELATIRDSILTASGALDRTAGGPPVDITKPADGMAKRIIETGASETANQVRSGFLFAFARTPTDAESKRSVLFIDEQARSYALSETPSEKSHVKALADFCHMLMSANEFLYVE